VPAALADIMERREHITVLPNDVAEVAGFLRSHAGRARPNLGAA
jgi:hypothetical protein